MTFPSRRILGTLAVGVLIGAFGAHAAEPELYRIELDGKTVVLAKNPPSVRGGRLVFTRYPDGVLVSLKLSGVRRVAPVAKVEAPSDQPREVNVPDPSELPRTGEAAPAGTLPPDPPGNRSTAVQAIPSAPAPPLSSSRTDRSPFTFTFNNLYLVDDNINHSLDDPHETRGAVFGLETAWKTPVGKPNFEISYEIARHFHTADEWDRLSHDVRAAWNPRLSKHWNVEAVGEVSLKGSTEDRDISDQYIFSPRIEYRFTRENRLRGYAAYRIRKFEEDPSRNANNRYVGIEYVYRGGVRRADIGMRYEVNRADSSRHHYTRWSYYADYTVPVGRRNRVTLEANYRPRRYDVRTIRVGDHRELRFDKSWILSAEAGHLLGSALEIFAGYRFETRSSNDADKRFNEHSAFAGVAYRF